MPNELVSYPDENFFPLYFASGVLLIILAVAIGAFVAGAGGDSMFDKAITPTFFPLWSTL